MQESQTEQARQFGDFAPDGSTISYVDFQNFCTAWVKNYGGSVGDVFVVARKTTPPNDVEQVYPLSRVLGSDSTGGVLGNAGEALIPGNPAFGLKLEILTQFNINHFVDPDTTVPSFGDREAGKTVAARFISEFKAVGADNSQAQVDFIKSWYGDEAAATWTTNLTMFRSGRS